VSVIGEFPYLISLYMDHCHHVCVELFLILHKLTINYDQLMIATQNFTKQTTRNTCEKVREIFIQGSREQYSKEFYYFNNLK